MTNANSTILAGKRAVKPPAGSSRETPSLGTLRNPGYSVALRTGAKLLPSNPGDSLKISRR